MMDRSGTESSQTLCWRKPDSNCWFLVEKVLLVEMGAVAGAAKRSRSGRHATRDRTFESGFLQSGVCRERDLVQQGTELERSGHRMPDSDSCTRLLAPL